MCNLKHNLNLGNNTSMFLNESKAKPNLYDIINHFIGQTTFVYKNKTISNNSGNKKRIFCIRDTSQAPFPRN